MGISPMGNSGCLPRGKPDATESRYPTYGACWVFQCFRNPPNSDMDYGVFNVRTDVNACDCAGGCMTTKESLHREKNPLPHRGIEPASAACRSDALTNWATSPLLLQNESKTRYSENRPRTDMRSLRNLSNEIQRCVWCPVERIRYENLQVILSH